MNSGSKKYLLLGSWQDKNDPTLQLKITDSKYITYVDGDKNWNNAWDTSTAIEYNKDSLSDDGDYIQVFLSEKEQPFYVQKIVLLTKSILKIEVVKGSGGIGDTKTFRRI